MAAQTTLQEPERRRRIRRNAVLLAVFAVLVYAGFIVTFVHSHS
jgi:hypothetical protein